MSAVLVGALSIELARAALCGRRADIIYTDPPWGAGNLRYWRTHNGEPDASVNWPSFLSTLVGVVRESAASNAHVFIEMGMRWVDELAEAMATAGFPERGRWQVLYGAPKRPNMLWYSGPGTDCNPTGMSGVAMTRHVLESVRSANALTFDPCCGKGMTARCALRLGMEFVGIELNPRRADVTRAWISGFRSGTRR